MSDATRLIRIMFAAHRAQHKPSYPPFPTRVWLLAYKRLTELQQARMARQGDTHTMAKLGVYWSVMHRRAQDYDYFKRLQPSVFKIMDGGAPDYQFARDHLPNSLVVARDWALSEQHADMLKDPVGTGKRHAQEWNQHQGRLGFDRAKTLILGINEPRIWEPGVPEALRLYTIALCDEATALNLRVGAMQLSVGWPNNDGPDTPPNWSLFHGVDNAIRANRGALVGHEYWADSGPGENWGWWAGRILKCPWQVPIIVGECGIDIYVKDGSVNHAQRGWMGRVEPERYAQELAEYVARMSEDSRFVGCCVFASDFASHEWYSFDIEPAYKAILATPIPEPETPDTPPVTVHLPAVGNEQPQPASATGYVTAPAGLWLRAAPDEAGVELVVVPYGQQVRIVAVANQDGWVRAQWGDSEGWMASRWISLQPPIPTEQPETPPAPVDEVVGDKWQRSRAFVSRWEGEYQNNPADIGNWTGCEVGKGENKGTKFGISACSYPQLDIQNLSMEEADAIYERDYWRASGADKLPWPYCLYVFDTAVLHGVGTARKWQTEVGDNAFAFAAKRLRVYTKLDNWNVFGAGWVNRVANLLEEASK